MKTKLFLGSLVIWDTLHPLAVTSAAQLPEFLSSLLRPNTSLVATYHVDIPLIPPVGLHASVSPYAPHPLTLLKYLSTAVLKVHSLAQVLGRKAARDRSLAEPNYGLGEGTEGVLRGLGA